MARGYDTNLVAQNALADDTKLGVRLGRVCISKRIPVHHAASTLGVSRQTIYLWFRGAFEPSKEHTAQIRKFISNASA